MVHRVLRSSPGVAAAVIVTIMIVPTWLVAQAGGGQSRGVSFDMKTAMTATGGMAGMLGGMVPSYSGHGVTVGARLRVDIVDGALPPLAEKGDYILFDTAGMTVVHPSKKEFVVLPADIASKAFDQMQAMGMSVSVSGVSMTLDTIAGTDTVAGYPTRHLRTTVDYTLTIEGMSVSQQMKSQATTDYWMATVPGLSSSPLQRTGQIGGGGQSFNSMSSMSPSGPFKELGEKSASLMSHLSGTALRTKATTTSDMGAAGTMGIDMTAEMSNIKAGPIADSMFVVPADYTRGASPLPGGN